MLTSSVTPAIRLRGVRHNNLKHFDLDLPLNKLIVITGLSGSGKSSLAFDTLFAEGQRRYIETFSPYARQFFDRMDKPQVDRIEGIPPAIAIEQRNSVRTTRSTVGTMTELCEYMKTLWPHISELHCRNCGRPVRKEAPAHLWQAVTAGPIAEAIRGADLLVTFGLPLSSKLSLEESLQLVGRQGYRRVLLNGEVVRIEDLPDRVGDAKALRCLTVVQDRVRPTAENRARFVEACEQAYHFGKGKLALRLVGVENRDAAERADGAGVFHFSKRLHCATCDIDYGEPSPALFSFNHPVGACPTCRGFGRVISIDYSRAVPDHSRTLAQGVVKPWLTGQGLECQSDLLRMCRSLGIPTDVPFSKLPKNWQDLVVEGDPEYGIDEEHEWPRAWYGVKGYFRWLESKAYKMHVRVLLSRYRAYTTCAACGGKRFQPEALLYLCANPHPDGKLSLADFYRLPARDALQFVCQLEQRPLFRENKHLRLILQEVRCRLEYLVAVGLGYLTLDRPTRTLSGGETERVNLTTCLGTHLVNTLFVLDEPSVGLHPRDTERLVGILKQLRDTGNTVVVVEHEPGIMREADQIVDLGPGHGTEGGHVVFQGAYRELLAAHKHSLTGAYLSGRTQIPIPPRRPVIPPPSDGPRTIADEPSAADRLRLSEALRPFRAKLLSTGREGDPGWLRILNATRHNLRNISVNIPLGRFVCITGVSGSGKSTLIRDVLLPELQERLGSAGEPGTKASDRLDNGGEDEPDLADTESGSAAEPTSVEGCESLHQAILVEQSALGKTPRSNPAVYIGAFEHMRDFFAQSAAARQRGLNSSAFSFNSGQGQCERCRGAGFEKVEMQFLSDVFIQCPDCRGRRYRSVILEVKVSPDRKETGRHPEVGRQMKLKTKPATKPAFRSFSIADLLEATVDEGVEWLSAFPESRPAREAVARLELLREVGLGYLKSGQPINTLSGGESQRLKLVRHLAEIPASMLSRQTGPGDPVPQVYRKTLFLFDEPTTGLHFHDVAVLLKVFQRLVDAGHSVLVIEHNLEVIKTADWVIDLGPEAGVEGGYVVAQGTPEDVAAVDQSHTGRFLRPLLEPTTGGHRTEKVSSAALAKCA